VERISWGHYVSQAKGLLKHLGIERAHMMGGCMGCSPVMAFAVAYPAMVRSMILFWPVGGAKYRIHSAKRFAEHIEFISANGLPAVVSLVTETGKSFGADPRGGPWASPIKNDPAFAERFAKLAIGPYKSIVQDMARGLIDRDTAPGAEAEDLLACEIPALVVPGADASHATSAARYLAECLPKSLYWDCPVENQTEQATAEKLLGFLNTSS
jgi:pimeloyl-ACP methyl ester carboxylesterase